MEKLKKVLFVTNIPAPYRVDFFNELGKKCDLTVIFESYRASVNVQYNWNDDDIQNFQAVYLTKKPFSPNKIKWAILKYFPKRKYDVIIISNYAYITEAIFMILLRISGKHFLYETDGGIIKDDSWIKKCIKHFFLSLSNGFFSPSVASDEYIRHYTSSKSVIFRYNFTSLFDVDIIKKRIDLVEKKNLKASLGIKEDKIILAIGRFVHRKGFDLLIKAFNQLNDKNVGLYIIGGIPSDEYRELANGMPNIHFGGFLSKEELKKYMSIADLFVHPTREDIWGLVINEAMSYGLPVLTTDKCVAGIELLSPNCIVPSENIEALKNGIKDIIYDDDILLSLSHKNLEKIKKYTIEEMVNNHICVFNKM